MTCLSLPARADGVKPARLIFLNAIEWPKSSPPSSDPRAVVAGASCPSASIGRATGAVPAMRPISPLHAFV